MDALLREGAVVEQFVKSDSYGLRKPRAQPSKLRDNRLATRLGDLSFGLTAGV